MTLKEEGNTFCQISGRLHVSIGSVHTAIRSNGDFISKRRNEELMNYRSGCATGGKCSLPRTGFEPASPNLQAKYAYHYTTETC